VSFSHWPRVGRPPPPPLGPPNPEPRPALFRRLSAGSSRCGARWRNPRGHGSRPGPLRRPKRFGTVVRWIGTTSGGGTSRTGVATARGSRPGSRSESAAAGARRGPFASLHAARGPIPEVPSLRPASAGVVLPSGTSSSAARDWRGLGMAPPGINARQPLKPLRPETAQTVHESEPWTTPRRRAHASRAREPRPSRREAAERARDSVPRRGHAVV